MCSSFMFNSPSFVTMACKFAVIQTNHNTQQTHRNDIINYRIPDGRALPDSDEERLSYAQLHFHTITGQVIEPISRIWDLTWNFMCKLFTKINSLLRIPRQALTWALQLFFFFFGILVNFLFFSTNNCGLWLSLHLKYQVLKLYWSCFFFFCNWQRNRNSVGWVWCTRIRPFRFLM